MIGKTERQLDLENLQQLQKAGKIDKEVNLEEIVGILPKWRKSSEPEDKRKLTKYGRGDDLDKLVHDENWAVRFKVAQRGRDQDLDKLISDPDEKVRYEVAYQGRGKDLDILVHDPSDFVREAVAKN